MIGMEAVNSFLGEGRSKTMQSLVQRPMWQDMPTWRDMLTWRGKEANGQYKSACVLSNSISGHCNKML